jgi:hypothetical protein
MLRRLGTYAATLSLAVAAIPAVLPLAMSVAQAASPAAAPASPIGLEWHACLEVEGWHCGTLSVPLD